jgi:acetamidase/formamidase
MGPHLLTGPIAVEGAQPGDVLEVRILAVELMQDWGWNVTVPVRGALGEVFAERHHRHFGLREGLAHLPWGGTLPVDPFFGCLGVAPAPGLGRLSSREPREFGGNIDVKELRPGSSLFLPVWAPGALFSAGDGHALQGDGEVDGTALETALRGRFEFHLHKGKGWTQPRGLTPTHHLTMGFHADLDEAVHQAVQDMVALVQELAGLAAEDAYALCTLACDLRVTQVVNGNKGIHAMLPRTALSRDI